MLVLDYRSMSNEALSAEKADLEKRYADFKARGLKLNMARGKPGVDQLDLSMPMLDILNSTSNIYASTGDDCRNYGLGDGLPEMRELFAEMLGIDDHNIIAVSYTHLVRQNTFHLRQAHATDQ